MQGGCRAGSEGVKAVAAQVGATLMEAAEVEVAGVGQAAVGVEVAV